MKVLPWGSGGLCLHGLQQPWPMMHWRGWSSTNVLPCLLLQQIGHEPKHSTSISRTTQNSCCRCSLQTITFRNESSIVVKHLKHPREKKKTWITLVHTVHPGKPVSRKYFWCLRSAQAAPLHFGFSHSHWLLTVDWQKETACSVSPF